jgi:uncharacterized membrane protein YsdA (DUF1294 family)/cold shock CspA family protein
MQPVRRRGTLTTWKDDKGFGFIKPIDGGQDVFVHITELKNLSRRPKEGDVVRYHLAADQRGKVRACNAVIEGLQVSVQSTVVEQRQLRRKPSSTKSVSQPLLHRVPLAVWVLLLATLPICGSIKLVFTSANFIPFILYLAMSLITFVIYAEDKSRAQQGKWRVPEKTLHLCEFMGGWMGGFVAQQLLRHKSSKSSYQASFWSIVTVHLMLWLSWLLSNGILIRSILPIPATR